MLPLIRHRTKLHPWALSAFFFFFTCLFGVLGFVGGAFSWRGDPIPVRPAELSGARHSGQCVTFKASRAVEAGYIYRGDPTNKTARLLAVPIDEKVLIVKVPLSHTGTSFTGTVSEMPAYVQRAVSQESLREFMNESQQRRKGLSIRRGAGGVPEMPEVPPTPPSFSEPVLPIIVDAVDDDFGLRVLVVILTAGSFVAGLVLLLRAKRSSAAAI